MPEPGDAGTLVAEQVLGVGPALVLFPTRLTAGTRTFSSQTSLTSQPPSSVRIGRTLTPGARMSSSSMEMPRWARAVIGADQAEHAVGVLRQRGPGLLAVDHVLAAVALGAGRQRGQVRTRTRLRITLAPPVLHADDARQQLGLLRGAAVLHQHRSDHGQAEGQQPRRARLEALDLEDQPLQRVPAGAAVLDGPGGRAPAAVGQDQVPAHIVVAFQPLMSQHLVADIRRQAGGGEGRDLAEAAQLGRPGQVHICLLSGI